MFYLSKEKKAIIVKRVTGKETALTLDQANQIILFKQLHAA